MKNKNEWNYILLIKPNKKFLINSRKKTLNPKNKKKRILSTRDIEGIREKEKQVHDSGFISLVAARRRSINARCHSGLSNCEPD